MGTYQHTGTYYKYVQYIPYAHYMYSHCHSPLQAPFGGPNLLYATHPRDQASFTLRTLGLNTIPYNTTEYGTGTAVRTRYGKLYD